MAERVPMIVRACVQSIALILFLLHQKSIQPKPSTTERTLNT